MNHLGWFLGGIAGLTSAGLGSAGYAAAAAPPNWSTYITAFTALIVALGTAIGAVTVLVKQLESRKITAAQLAALGDVADTHEARIDKLDAAQAKLEALTGLPHGNQPG